MEELTTITGQEQERHNCDEILLSEIWLHSMTLTQLLMTMTSVIRTRTLHIRPSVKEGSQYRTNVQKWDLLGQFKCFRTRQNCLSKKVVDAHAPSTIQKSSAAGTMLTTVIYGTRALLENVVWFRFWKGSYDVAFDRLRFECTTPRKFDFSKFKQGKVKLISRWWVSNCRRRTDYG